MLLRVLTQGQIEELPEVHRRHRFDAAGQSRRDHNRLLVTFKPGEEDRLRRPRQSLLLDLMVEGAHIGIDERSREIQLRREIRVRK